MKYLLLILTLSFLPVAYSFGDIGVQEGIIISPNITFSPSILNVSKLRFPETPVDIEKSIATDKALKGLEAYLEGKSYNQIPSEVIELGESDYTSLNNILNSLETKRKEYYSRNKPVEIKVNFEGSTAFLEVEKDVKIQIDFNFGITRRLAGKPVANQTIQECTGKLNKDYSVTNTGRLSQDYSITNIECSGISY